MTKDDVLKRTRECGDCLEWTGSFVHDEAPVLSIGGKKHYVKRYLLAKTGRDLNGKCVISTCGNTSCVNPKHLLVVSRADVLHRTRATGIASSLAVRAKVAAGKRKNSKLSQEAAEQIRISEESGASLAQRYGISKEFANLIRRGKTRRDYSSPFAGVIHRAIQSSNK